MINKVKKISKSPVFTAVNIGTFDNLNDYENGKVFLKDIADSTAAEVSFQMLPKNTELPFFHAHKQNEEIYIVLRGQGSMQIDDNVFDISEGSIVRVAPNGMRTMKSGPDTEMLYMVIQAKENSLTQWTQTDGIIENKSANW